MAEAQSPPGGPDLTAGVELALLPEGAPFAGHVGDESVVLVRRGQSVFAVSAQCTHYGGPLAEGLVVGDTIRCPWHHGAFCLRTGEPLRAPPLNPIDCWLVEREGDLVRVRQKAAPPPAARIEGGPASVVIIGGGAAGAYAAETLRREGYGGKITMLSADDAPPCDRPNLSKDYLAGTAPEEWIPLRPSEFYAEHRIDLHLGARVTAIDTVRRKVTVDGGDRHTYDALLIATGAEPVRLNLPGADLPHVHYLRSLGDSRAIIEAAQGARNAVVIGASFIGLEVAASLRNRGLAVHVAAPEQIPMERVLGPELGQRVRQIHEEHGVLFHLGQTATTIDAEAVTLTDGQRLPADLVVVGVGVRPALALAEQAGLAIDRGVTVDEYLQTSAPGVFAAGDLARWPDPHTNAAIRVEHWVVAERQGRTAARNMLSKGERFDAVPFFWSQHYDIGILYVGHAERWDAVEIDGDIGANDCRVSYLLEGRILAVATIGRDAESLQAELLMERQPLAIGG